jgi:DNA-binding MarR family transcriptional regulator
MADPSRDRLIQEIWDALDVVLRTTHARAAPVWRELDLSTAQLKVLYRIAHTQPVTVGKLARWLGVSGPTASHLVDRLVQAGLAERAEDPHDRRRTLVRLTEAGEHLHQRLRDGNRAALNELLTRLSLDELSALHQGMAALARVAEAEQERPVPAPSR